jgi:uncharacterized membrane protein YpjA
LNRTILWMIFWVNGLGTLYGYEWYANQMVHTVQEYAFWLVWFVPDSPTASLFFTAAVAFLLADSYRPKASVQDQSQRNRVIRSIVEAFAVITSVKYGIWAVVMIFWGALEGSSLEWQNWMLVCSHLGMAAEALLFLRFFKFRGIHILVVAIWTLANDWIDYKFGVFPWLPKQLHDDLSMIQIVTIGLSGLGILCAFIPWAIRNKFTK